MNWWIVGLIWLVVALAWAYTLRHGYKLWTNVRDSPVCAWCDHTEHPWNWRAFIGMNTYHEWLTKWRTAKYREGYE